MPDPKRLPTPPGREDVDPAELDDYDFVSQRTQKRYSEYATPKAYFGALMNSPPLAAALVEEASKRHAA